MEPRTIELQMKRFTLEILEERAAPAHVTVAVPDAAGVAVEHVNGISPHTGLIKELIVERFGRVFESGPTRHRPPELLSAA